MDCLIIPCGAPFKIVMALSGWVPVMGLNRYDGRGNKVYRNVLNEKFSLENNFVEALIEVDKNLWVGTNSGLYIYDRDTDRFSYFDKTTQYNVYISSEIKKIIKTENGLIWIATLGQGFLFMIRKQRC